MKYENVSEEKFLKSLKKSQEIGLIKKAVKVCEKELAQKDFVSLLNTANLLSSLGLKDASISAVMLFETKMDSEEIKKEFTEETKNLVDSIRKIRKIENQRKNFDAETLSKIILATTQDVRTTIMVLALKLSKLRSAKKEDKELANLVKDIFLPISQKLGLEEVAWELEDLSFKILEQEKYLKMKNIIKRNRNDRENDLKKIENEIKKTLKKENINAKVIGRVKNLFGIYKKMKRKKCKLKDVHDLIAIRIICDTVKECYIILGIIHAMYESLLNSFDDYIASPKKNNYRSIHTDLKTADGKVFETQIRTWEMHAEAEEGTPAHWLYKDIKKNKEFDSELTWAKQLIEWSRKSKSKKIIESLKLRFEEKKIFVLTPNSDIIELVPGATPLDFAYAIHPSIGNTCEKTLVNGKIVSLDYELDNGDVVEIITSKKQVPKSQWLTIVKTNKAKSKIRQFLKIKKEKKSKKEPQKILKKIINSIKISKCCNPIPGDKIFAIKTTKRKLTIHRENCENLKREDQKKVIPINWGMIGKRELSAEIKIKAKERINLLTEILDVIALMKGRVISTDAKVEKGSISCNFVLQTKKPEIIRKIVEKIRKIDGIKEVNRG